MSYKRDDGQTVEQLRAWATDAEHEIAEILTTIAPLQDRLGAARERLDLITRLLRLAEHKSSTIEEKTSSSVRAPTGSPPVSKQLEDHMVDVLRAGGQPMHISSIREALINKGVPLPGRGEEANIILRLRRLPLVFTRTGRGTYGLAEWHIPEAPLKTTRIRRRRVG